MKLKFLLFFLLTTTMLNAQVVCDYPEGVNTSLVITEARIRGASNFYIEITNMSENPVQLSDYKLGYISSLSEASPIVDLCNDPWFLSTPNHMFLPNRTLEPGKSFVLTTAYDFRPEWYRQYLGRNGGDERVKQEDIYEVADKLVHMQESIEGVVYPGDSVTTPLNDPETLRPSGDYGKLVSGGIGGTIYLEHHYTDGDSAVIDQIGGVFDNGGRNYRTDYDIAGITGGVSTSICIRKFSIKNGNIDFASGRGVNIQESEWMPIEILDGYDEWRDIWWTVGNHGNFILDENTLESDDLVVDFAGKKITVPWGTLRLDDIMRHMKKKPGIAWNYQLNANVEDSLYRSARNGDKLIIYVVGNELQIDSFEIAVEAPTADDNMVIPIDHRRNELEGPVTNNTQDGILSWPRVTRNESGIDTITGSGFGLAYDLRVDSLLKYLEKPANASWELVWVDGQERPDLKNGDKLKVTSQNGKVKEYYLQLQTYRPSQNAYLASITWPDIPEYYKGVFGWKGDTIPNFSSGSTNYQIKIPNDISGIPGLIAKTDHPNARVQVERATTFNGTLEDRTMKFTVTAEDDTTVLVYTIELVKEKFPNEIEPYVSDIFISEFDNSIPNGNCYLELYNPGNQPIDLRNYMVAMRGSADPASPMTSYADPEEGDWNMRYTTYIPGLKHADLETWLITPRVMQPDINVSPWLQPNETFVLANISRGPGNGYYEGLEIFRGYDVQFQNETVPGFPNPWGEYVRTSSSGGIPIPPNGNRRNSIFLYKVLNDSVKLGLKPNTDPNDFQLIDYWGMAEREYWVIGGIRIPNNQTNHAFIRKPHILKGNPVLGGSFGTNEEDCEWTWTRTGDHYGHIPLPERDQAALNNLGFHYMIQPTFYKSTVRSKVYKVSPGFGAGQEIVGIKTGVSVADFFANLIKEDEGQTLTVKSLTDGSELAHDALLSLNDTLVVMSADSTNKTYYRLNVSELGLSSDALLTSNMFDIQIQSDPKSGSEAQNENAGAGTISGMEYGTTLQFIVNNINIPAGANMSMINGDGAYVSYKILNFDTAYVQATVSPDIYFEVTAEDGKTIIVYQLQPETSQNDAFILSDLYTVIQKDNLVSNIPGGTSVSSFLTNVTASLGASLQVYDKMGYPRTAGTIKEDDKILVTSANGLKTRVYHVSLISNSFVQKVYLAYVLSSVYQIDQVGYIINGATGKTTLQDFYSKIRPATGATAIIVDANGNEKSTGDLDDGDMVKVTSLDGGIVVYYTLNLDLTGVEVNTLQQFNVYPNPSEGELNVSGLIPGNRIQLVNVMGVVVKDITAQSSQVSFNLNDQPRGIYIIAISDNNKLLGLFKAAIQ